MPKIHRLAIHHRAASDQAIDIVSLALRYGLLRYAPLSEGAVQPYVVDTKVRAFPDDLRGHVRVSNNHHGFDRLRNWMKIRIASITLYSLGVRIDRVDLVTRDLQLPIPAPFNFRYIALAGC
jgi:hypothetical protein